jgi:hypothetical protein
MDRNDWDFKHAEREVVIVTDAKLNRVCVTYMTKMNGYIEEEEVIGKSPKMFQGDNSNLQLLVKFDKAIQLQQP